MPKTKCAEQSKENKYPELHIRIAVWVEEHKQNGYVITRSALRLHAMKQARKMEL